MRTFIGLDVSTTATEAFLIDAAGAEQGARGGKGGFEVPIAEDHGRSGEAGEEGRL
ncbi:MAG: hypothetical protein K8T20_13370 [Planctomycetes bacterium]|nr:hypothetical protein [Planctomycetota bacterium]